MGKISTNSLPLDRLLELSAISDKFLAPILLVWKFNGIVVDKARDTGKLDLF